MTDILTTASSYNAVNWLKNGNFIRIPRQLKAQSYPQTGTTRLCTLASAVTPTDVSVPVMIAPKSDFLADWTISGNKDGVSSIDFDPVDLKSGVRMRSMDGGRLIRVSFFQTGEVLLEQELVVVNQFRGMEATLAFTVRKITGDVTIWPELDFGTSTKTFNAIHSSEGYYRRPDVVVCPLDLTKIVVRLRLATRSGSACGISGIMFALGAYDVGLPYCDNPAEGVMPRGAVILWAGAACPPGYRPVDGESGRFLYQVPGDPNAVSGGTEEYPDVLDPNTQDYAYYVSKRPEVQSEVGSDDHFAHQRAGMIGDKVDSFDSLPPDVQRRMETADFNDKGEPPGPGPVPWAVRDASPEACRGAGAQWPYAANAVAALETFKTNTQQNEVLPGGAGDPDSPGAYPADVWRDPHKHTFYPKKDDITLPPWKGFLFCEKI